MWMLFLIVLEANQYMVAPQGPFQSLEVCQEARTYVLQTALQPEINYGAICIQTNHNIGGA